MTQLEYASPQQQQTTWDRAVRGFLAVIAAGGWIVAGLFLVGMLVGLFGLFGGPLATYFGIVVALLAVVCWGTWRRIARARRAAAVLAQLRVGVALNLPLPQVLSGAASAETGRTRRQLVELRDALMNGQPIGQALTQVVPELPPRTLDTLAAAERNGTLDVALAREAGAGSDSAAAAKTRAAIQGTYSLLMLAVVIAVLMLLMIFIMPKFERIFMDFNLALPWEMKLLLTTARDFWWLAILIAILAPLVVLCMAGSAARALFVAKIPQPLWRDFSDRLKWYLPLSHAIQRDRGLADACEVFADGIAAGRPAADALEIAILPSINRVLTVRLRTWLELLRHGRPLHESAAAAELPSMFAVLLAPGFAADGSPEALRFLARYYRDRHERLIALLRAAITPLATLLLGGAVLLITVGLFRSMQVLINAVDPLTLSP